MAKKDYIRTPDSANRIVDTNLKIDKVFVLPDFNDSPDLNDTPDEAGAVRYNNGRMEMYLGNDIWKQIAYVGEGGNSGSPQAQSFITFINQTDQSLIDAKIITDENGKYSFFLSPSVQSAAGINNLTLLNSTNNQPMLVSVITTENGDYDLNIKAQ